MHPAPNFIDELVNIEISKRLRWADALKCAGEFELAETVFPDTPEYELREQPEERNAA